MVESKITSRCENAKNIYTKSKKYIVIYGDSF